MRSSIDSTPPSWVNALTWLTIFAGFLGGAAYADTHGGSWVWVGLGVVLGIFCAVPVYVVTMRAVIRDRKERAAAKDRREAEDGSRVRAGTRRCGGDGA